MDRNGIKVTLDRPRVMKITLDSAELAEEKWGINILAFDQSKIGPSALKKLLFVSLLDDDKDLEPSHISAMIEAYEPGLTDLIEKSAQALADFTGVDVKTQKNPQARHPAK
jgi:hypothetical protein